MDPKLLELLRAKMAEQGQISDADVQNDKIAAEQGMITDNDFKRRLDAINAERGMMTDADKKRRFNLLRNRLTNTEE